MMQNPDKNREPAIMNFPVRKVEEKKSKKNIIEQMEKSEKQKNEFDPSPFAKPNTQKIDEQLDSLLNNKI